MKSYRKSRSLILIAALIIINGCNPNTIPFKGKYPTTQFEVNSTKSIDSIWTSVRDLFISRGLPVKTIDKKLGLIVSAKISFIPVYTFENNDGQLQEPQAWVVLHKLIVNKKEWNPKEIYGKWSIQISETEKGTTIIKVDPIVMCTYSPNMVTSVETRGQSTGKLEELIKSTLLK